MNDNPSPLPRKPSIAKNILRMICIAIGCVALLLPGWLPNSPENPIQSSTIEILQSLLLAAATAVIMGASSHAGAYRPVCRAIAFALVAAFLGEIEDILSHVFHVKFPMHWLIAPVILATLITILRHKRVISHFCTTAGQHAGSGFIGSALLILYAFNGLIGKQAFWKATLGPNVSPLVAKTCSGYLELLACYLIFVGILGFSITLARRRDPS